MSFNPVINPVPEAQLGSNSVTTDKIAANAVTLAKISDGINLLARCYEAFHLSKYHAITATVGVKLPLSANKNTVLYEAANANDEFWDKINITTGTYGSVVNGAYSPLGYIRDNSGAQVVWNTKFYVAKAATYTLSFRGYKNTDAAIATIKIDGAANTTIDMYGAFVANSLFSASLGALAVGEHTIEFSNPTRHGSSTGWTIQISQLLIEEA